MAKRFTSTEIWSEDWFLEMPLEYKLFWYYVLAECDYAGFFKINLRSFCGLNGVKISSDTALAMFNNGKDRIRVINKSIWFVEDFFAYQYGQKFNINNPLHKGILKLYDKFDLNLTSIRGVLDVSLTLKEKEKDMYLKDRGVGKENNLNKNINGTSKQPVNFKAQGETLYAERLARHKAKIDENRGEDNLQQD